MRKLMVLGALLAMMLVSVAPAFAQQIGGDQGLAAGDDAVQAGENTQYAAGSQNIIGTVDLTADQVATATATGGDNVAATAEIDQTQYISVTQTNRSFDGVW